MWSSMCIDQLLIVTPLVNLTADSARRAQYAPQPKVVISVSAWFVYQLTRILLYFICTASSSPGWGPITVACLSTYVKTQGLWLTKWIRMHLKWTQAVAPDAGLLLNTLVSACEVSCVSIQRFNLQYLLSSIIMTQLAGTQSYRLVPVLHLLSWSPGPKPEFSVLGARPSSTKFVEKRDSSPAQAVTVTVSQDILG